MRLARFRTGSGSAGFGVVSGGHVARLDHRVASFADLLAAPVPPAPGDPRVAVDDLAWEPPLGDHPKIVCVGFNYAAHAGESDRAAEAPEHPTLFTRFGDSVVGAGTPVVRPLGEDSLDWEGEAALVIGLPGRRIPPEKASRTSARSRRCGRAT
jgi:2-keto-4-pentenoate hydratase/2-oxohepta-3-ene-1,7-dioic acid hydratase in catechol pathway